MTMAEQKISALIAFLIVILIVPEEGITITSTIRIRMRNRLQLRPFWSDPTAPPPMAVLLGLDVVAV